MLLKKILLFLHLICKSGSKKVTFLLHCFFNFIREIWSLQWQSITSSSRFPFTYAIYSTGSRVWLSIVWKSGHNFIFNDEYAYNEQLYRKASCYTLSYLYNALTFGLYIVLALNIILKGECLSRPLNLATTLRHRSSWMGSKIIVLNWDLKKEQTDINNIPSHRTWSITS